MDCEASTSINIKHKHGICYPINSNNYIDGYYKQENTKDIKFRPKHQIKCEKNCFAIVDKWYTKLFYKLPMEVNLNKLIERELVFLKVKYPFLTDRQRRGKALVKFGIPNSMGNILRTGSGKITKIINQKLWIQKSGNKIPLNFNIVKKFCYSWPLKSEIFFFHFPYDNMDKENLPSTSRIFDLEPDTTNSPTKALSGFSRRRRFSKIALEDCDDVNNNNDYSNDKILKKRRKYEPIESWPSIKPNFSPSTIETLQLFAQKEKATEKLRQFYDDLEKNDDSALKIDVSHEILQLSSTNNDFNNFNNNNFNDNDEKEITANERMPVNQNIKACFEDERNKLDNVLSFSSKKPSSVITSANQKHQSTENVPEKVSEKNEIAYKINNLKFLELLNKEEQASEQLKKYYDNLKPQNNDSLQINSDDEHGELDSEQNLFTLNSGNDKVALNTQQSQITDSSFETKHTVSFLSTPIFTQIPQSVESAIYSVNLSMKSNFTTNLSESEAFNCKTSADLNEKLLNPLHPDYETYQLIDRLRNNLKLQMMKISADDGENVEENTIDRNDNFFSLKTRLLQRWNSSNLTTPDLSQIALSTVSFAENIWENMTSRDFSNPGIQFAENSLPDFSPFSLSSSEDGDCLSQDIKSPILGFVSESFSSTSSCSQVFSNEKNNDEANLAFESNAIDKKNENLLSNVCSEYEDEDIKQACAPKLISTSTGSSNIGKKISSNEIRRRVNGIIRVPESED